MTVDERSVEFVSTLDRERASLQGTVYLLLDDPRSAADILDATLAQLYVRRVAPAELRIAALRSLVREDTQSVLLPWTRTRRFELRDGPPRVVAEDIVADLRRLPRDERAALVLGHFTELPSVEIADLLGRPVDEVVMLARQARAAVTAGHPDRESDEGLAAELRSAVPYDWQASRGGVTDVAHGHRLILRQRLRRGLVAAATLLALVLLITQLGPQPAPEPVALPPAVSLPPVARASCDTRETTCQNAVLQDWRAKMVEVANLHLDREQSNPFRVTSVEDGTSASNFWSGPGGALTVELSRTGRDMTHLRLQIASSRAYAVPCGQTTSATCSTTRFMDGNRFTMTDPDLARGVEVQYSPYGDEVITAIARHTKSPQAQRSEEPSVGRADLVDLIQDERLRLPGR